MDCSSFVVQNVEYRGLGLVATCRDVDLARHVQEGRKLGLTDDGPEKCDDAAGANLS